jgi:hypothetical protein
MYEDDEEDEVSNYAVPEYNDQDAPSGESE